jgi:hypothetical protein
MKRQVLVVFVVITVCLLTAFAATAAMAWDAAADFSETANPNGPWAFGWTDTGGVFTAFPSLGADWYGGYHTPTNGISAWYDYYAFPVVGHSNTGGSVNIWSRCLPLTTNMVMMCPGAAATGREASAVVKWTADSCGVYAISALFTQLDGGNAGVAVYTTSGSVNWTGALLIGQGASASTAPTVSLAAGESVFFACNQGADGTNSYDTIGLRATVTAIPEPSCLTVLFAGAGSAAVVLRRKRV